MESSHQSTSDRAIFKCLGKSFIFGFVMGSIETFFAGAARILLSGQSQHHVPYSRPPEPRNFFVSFDSVTDDTP